MVDAGIYTIVFWNSSNDLLNTEPFAASADYADTWIWGIVFRDYLITASATSAAGVETVISAVVRVSPGRNEPPAPPWDRTTVSWISSEVTIMSWEPP